MKQTRHKNTNFIFDSDTLTYKIQKKSVGKTFLKFLLFVSIVFVVGFAINILYSSYFLSPKERYLNQEQEAIMANYDILLKKLEVSSSNLSRIEQRDDKFYRTIFELQPLPASVREAGFGGVNRYNDLTRFTNSDYIIDVNKKVDKFVKKVVVQSESFDEVGAMALNKEKMITNIPSVLPLSPQDFRRISDHYGVRAIHPVTGLRAFHDGIDVVGPRGCDVHATGNGTVISSGNRFNGYGNMVVVDHEFGYVTKYAHLDKVLVKKGQLVKRGDVIGALGNTGRSSGPHLHYEIVLKRRTKNPIGYFYKDISQEEYVQMIEQYSETAVRN